GIYGFGPPNVIRVEQVPPAAPGPGEVRIRTEACGVGFWDALVRMGSWSGTGALPLTLGAEVAGTVEALGPGVIDFAPGDAVFGITCEALCGGYAESCNAVAALLARIAS